MFTLRKPESEERYQREKQSVTVCPFCRENALYSWKHWSLRKNEYPYDLVADTHDILSLSRHCDEMNLEEREELEKIKRMKFMGEYHSIIENLPAKQSVPGHFHLHLIRYKE